MSLIKFAISTGTGLIAAACADKKCSTEEKVVVGLIGGSAAFVLLSIAEEVVKDD